ncbi:MAG: sugar phosphate nucleotidyltransferase [Chitinophagales bacterium]
MVPVIILCGGLGTRLKAYEEDIPKPLVPVGGVPILRHIISYYKANGCYQFVLAVGHQAAKIEAYFRQNPVEEVQIVFSNAGEKAGTGERLEAAMLALSAEEYLLSYGDIISDINIRCMIEAHRQQEKLITLAVVKPLLPYGVFKYDGDVLASFEEKPQADFWINAGSMVVNKNLFPQLKGVKMLEGVLLNLLVKSGQLQTYRHNGNWRCMDTYKDYLELNEVWGSTKNFWG